ncbi:MAG: hypothetical protein J2P21_31475 [Chloracidobacterium sp.]|nr:hypothetical protein [Chloracidobacterium sp.]
MHSKFFQVALLIVVLTAMVPPVLLAAGEQGSGSADQKYAGLWAGTFTTDGGDTNKLSYTLKKDGKGEWGGTVKWVNSEGEQSADFKSLEIADGKMKGKIESPDGQVEVAIEGQFQGDKLEGAYAISPKGSTEVTEKGTWKVTKSVTEKTGQ